MVNAEDRECRVFSDDVPTSIRGRPLCRRGSSNRVAIARQPRRRHVLPKFPSRRVASGQSAQFLADGEGSEVIGRSLSLSLSLSLFLPFFRPVLHSGEPEETRFAFRVKFRAAERAPVAANEASFRNLRHILHRYQILWLM